MRLSRFLVGVLMRKVPSSDIVEIIVKDNASWKELATRKKFPACRGQRGDAVVENNS
jgi:hypothetical protein